MSLTGRTRLAKRKHEIKEVRRKNQTATSQKHDKRCIKKIPESLQKKLDKLVEENTNNVIMIEDPK